MEFHAAYELGLSLDRNHDPACLQLFRRADLMLDKLWDRLGSDELKMTFLADRENVYTHLVRSTVNESPESAFGYSEKARSRVLRERLLDKNVKNVMDVSHSAAGIRSRLSAGESIVEYFINGSDLCIFVLRQDGLTCVQKPGVIDRLKGDWQDLERHFESCSVKWERLVSVRQHLETTAQRHLRSLYSELITP